MKIFFSVGAHGFPACRQAGNRGQHALEIIKTTKAITFRDNLSSKLWEHTGSNRGPSACKADALNQLSYAPIVIWECKDKS